MDSLVPVPETERMEEFTVNVPTLRIKAPNTGPERPPTLRRTTEPSPSSPLSPSWSSPMPYRPRNTSPYSRGHLRSKSSTSSLAPQMARAQSLPGVNAAGHLAMSPHQRPASPSSPRNSPNRVRIPRKPADEVFPGLPNRMSGGTNDSVLPVRTLGGISEVEAVEDTSTTAERSISPILGLPPSHTFPRRRPASPLRYIVHQDPDAPPNPILGSSPSFSTTSRFESSYSYPGSFASSSVPSTPTSARSRSPSISSLETIPDSPDAEEAALEADRIAQLKIAAEAVEDGEDGKPKPAPEGLGIRGRSLGFSSRDKRKRWSVCGAERRGDLNLDTIWED